MVEAMFSFHTGVVVAIPSEPVKNDVFVDVERSEETVRSDEVAIRESPSAEEVMNELRANDVAFVPPFETASVPVIVVRVVVACHVGTPLTSARTWPLVPCDVVARAPAPLPSNMVLA